MFPLLPLFKAREETWDKRKCQLIPERVILMAGGPIELSGAPREPPKETLRAPSNLKPLPTN